MGLFSKIVSESHAFHGPQIQDQGQRPVSPVSRVENQAALSKLVPRLYLG